MSIMDFLHSQNWRTMLCVDPGATTGWAFFNYSGLVSFGSLPCPRKVSGENKRHFWLMYNFDKLGRSLDPEGVIIESMEHWAGSETSDASTNSGALFKVDRLSGGFGGVCAVRGTPYQFLTAKAWKGQLTKEATRLRVLRAIPGTELKDEHSTDAIGIGLALGGEL